VDETYKNLTLEERLYLYDGYGAKWGFDVGNDGLWFVPQHPIGDTYSAPFKIRNGATDNALVVGSNEMGKEGSVGIGTPTPVEAVDIYRNNAAARFQLTSETNSPTEAAQFIQRRKKVGGSGAPLYGDSLGLFSFRGWNGTEYTGSKGAISVGAYEDWDAGSNGTYMIISMTPKGSTTPQHIAKFMGDGNVYIPNGNLYVKGTKMNVPDYVFKDNYKLMPLDELKAYVKKNNHLPGVTSADEVGKAGMVNLSGLQMNLLEKVEELTLYTLQQEEALASKDAEMKEMKEKVAKLETMQKRLAKVESLLTNLALDTSGTNKEKVSVNFK